MMIGANNFGRVVDFKDAIQSCFSAETVDECVKKLEAMSNDQSSSTRDWAKSTVAEVKKVDKELLQVLSLNIAAHDCIEFD